MHQLQSLFLSLCFLRVGKVFLPEITPHLGIIPKLLKAEISDTEKAEFHHSDST